MIYIIKEGGLGERPSWDEYGMKFAIDASSRSSCWNVRAGSVITLDNQIIATGYNGAPGAIKKNCLESGCRKSLKGLDYHESLGCGECIGIHSEMNAVGHLSKRGMSKLVLYNTIFPCHTCAKDILPYNFQKIFFKRMYSEKEAKSTLELLEEAGIEIYQLDLSPERVLDIEFNHPNVKFDVWSPEEKERIKNIFLK